MGMPSKAIVLLVPSLLFGIGAPTWPGTADQAAPTNAQVMTASPYTLLGMTSSVLTATDGSPREPKDRCNLNSTPSTTLWAIPTLASSGAIPWAASQPPWGACDKE